MRMSHAFIGPLRERERRIPRSGDAQGEECRMGEKAAYLIPETL